ncbi:PAS domain-containing sensor histidine kinase [Flavobacterium sp. GNP001]
MKKASLMHALVHNAIDGIITIDEHGIVASINPTACRLFGYREAEVLGNNVSMLMPMPEKEKHDFYLEQYKLTGNAHIIGIGRELIGKAKSGTLFPFKLGVSEVVYANKKIFIGFIHDLTQQKIDEARLKEYASHLKELVEERTKTLNKTIKALEKSREKVRQTLEKEKTLSHLKNRFLSMASHEFRTPLSTVHLSASLIEKYAEAYGNANITKHVGKIVNSVTNLTTVLNDFLYIEQLEIGKVVPRETCFDLVLLATEITEEMQLLAKPKQKIKYSHSGEVQEINLDKNLLKNCLINLISNAIKYSNDTGCIALTTEIDDQQCIIKVKDDGIGIPIDDQPHLFEPFFRAHNTGTIPGTGLGLNIVARYIALMRGQVSCSSSTEKGSIFTLTFSKLCEK